VKKQLLIGTMIVLGASAAASAQYVNVTVLDGVANTRDMSPDGRYVVGDLGGGGGGYLLDRKTGEMTILPAPGMNAVAVSDDGTVVIGDIPDPEGIGSNVAAIWTQASNEWVSLGALPNALGCPSRSDAYELSADGTVAVGLSWDGCSGRAFRWTEATGMVEMGVLGSGGNRASTVSADGSLLGGFAQGSFSRTPTVWDGSGAGALLDPPDGDVVGEVRGMSDDGTILVGNWDSKAFKLVEGEPIELFSGPIAAWVGNAMDVADDDTIVGFDSFSTNRRAWIRPNGGPAVDMVNYLVGLGADPPVQMEVAHTLSANGNVIAGLTFFSTPAWIVDLCVPDLNGNGAVDFADILEIIGAWGPCSGCAADLNGNGAVDFADILVVIGAWGPCPH